MRYQDKHSPWSSHSRILAHLETLPENSKVLDVGTATGMLARRSQRQMRFFGIEAVPEWAQTASPYYEKMWNCTLETATEEILSGYDAVVFGDVLEHLSEPNLALKRIIGLQPSGCKFIISVPNVANILVRLSLLFGHFDYAERGILDRTHLRFFTYKTFISLLKEAGLDILCIHVTPIPLELVSPFFSSSVGRFLYAIFAHVTFLLPTLMGFQFVAETRKP